MSDKTRLKVTVKSFSYRKEIPQDTSGNGGGYVFDCRGILNPGRKLEFKVLNGKDKEIREFIEQLEGTDVFFDSIRTLIERSVRNYIHRDFSDLMVCFGCTGGQHRSVYFAERTAQWLKQNFPVEVDLKHTEEANWPQVKVAKA